MDLAHPITAIAPTATGAVLEALAHERRALSGAAVARLLEGRVSRKGVLLALRRLVEVGLVHVEEGDHSHRFQVNRRHLALSAVVALVDLRSQLVESVRESVASWTVPPEAAWLLRLDGRHGPDGYSERRDGDKVEVVVLRPALSADQELAWAQQLGTLMSDVVAWTGNPCTVRSMDRAEFDERWQALDLLLLEVRHESTALVPCPDGLFVARRIDPTG